MKTGLASSTKILIPNCSPEQYKKFESVFSHIGGLEPDLLNLEDLDK